MKAGVVGKNVIDGHSLEVYAQVHKITLHATMTHPTFIIRYVYALHKPM